MQDNDAFVDVIKRIGYNPKQNRWITAQMLQESHYERTSFDRMVKEKGYAYEWKTVLNHIRETHNIENHIIKANNDIGDNMAVLPPDSICSRDDEICMTLINEQIKILKASLQQRNRFINKELADKMFDRYINEILPEYFWRYTYKKEYRKKFGNTHPGIVLMDLKEQLLKQHADDPNWENYYFWSYLSRWLYVPSKNYYNNGETIELIDPDWKAAFEKNGAYLTMSNLIQYHGARFFEHQNMDSAINDLNTIPENNLFDEMTAFIRRNDITIENLY